MRRRREGREEEEVKGDTQRERKKNVFEDIIGKNFPNLGKETGIQVQDV